MKNTDYLDNLTRIESKHQACGESVTSFVLGDESSYARSREVMREHVAKCWASKRATA